MILPHQTHLVEEMATGKLILTEEQAENLYHLFNSAPPEAKVVTFDGYPQYTLEEMLVLLEGKVLWETDNRWKFTAISDIHEAGPRDSLIQCLYEILAYGLEHPRWRKEYYELGWM